MTERQRSDKSFTETLTAYQRTRQEADVLVSLYDPAVFQRHPNVIGARLEAERGDPVRTRAAG